MMVLKSVDKAVSPGVIWCPHHSVLTKPVSDWLCELWWRIGTTDILLGRLIDLFMPNNSIFTHTVGHLSQIQRPCHLQALFIIWRRESQWWSRRQKEARLWLTILPRNLLPLGLTYSFLLFFCHLKSNIQGLAGFWIVFCLQGLSVLPRIKMQRKWEWL